MNQKRPNGRRELIKQLMLHNALVAPTDDDPAAVPERPPSSTHAADAGADPPGNTMRQTEVYRQRAVQMAEKPSAQRTGQTTRVLVCGLGRQRIGIELSYVVKIFRALQCTPVPGALPHVIGLANFGGRIRPVLDLRQMLVAESPDDPMGSILLVRAQGRTVGLRVDCVEKVQAVDYAQLAHPDPESHAGNGKFLHGITSDHLAIVCPEQLLRQTAVAGEVTLPSLAEDMNTRARGVPVTTSHSTTSLDGSNELCG